jgi:hypothetical protein
MGRKLQDPPGSSVMERPEVLTWDDVQTHRESIRQSKFLRVLDSAPGAGSIAGMSQPIDRRDRTWTFLMREVPEQTVITEQRMVDQAEAAAGSDIAVERATVIDDRSVRAVLRTS